MKLRADGAACRGVSSQHRTIRSIPVALPTAIQRLRPPISRSGARDVKLETAHLHLPENNQRFVPLKYSVRGRDLGSTVRGAARSPRRCQCLKLQSSTDGEFGALVEAQKRLAVIVPLSLALDLHAALQPVPPPRG